jgi:peroxiredoxin
MARTPSTMPELGRPAPDFDLPDANGRRWRRDDFASAPGLLVMFICNHCPFVVHIRDELARFARDYQARGLAIVAVNSNDWTQYPDDSPEHMMAEAERAGYVFPYLVDESQAVATAYDAACTPDFFLYDAERTLYYRGQFDGARPGQPVAVTGQDLRAACDALLAGQPFERPQRPSLGCNIKWKVGNETNA